MSFGKLEIIFGVSPEIRKEDARCGRQYCVLCHESRPVCNFFFSRDNAIDVVAVPNYLERDRIWWFTARKQN